MELLRTLFAAAAAAALVAACGKGAETPSSATAPAKPGASAQAVSVDAIQADAQGFTVGQAMSARTVYVFFDAQCPHCGALWYAAKPLLSQAKFVWIPVRLLNDASESQGAALLAAKDPSAAMDEHEASLMDRKGGLKAEGDLAAQRAAIKKNTDLFNKFGLASVPSMVMKNSQTGAVVTHEGSMQTPQLAAFLGVPAQGK